MILVMTMIMTRLTAMLIIVCAFWRLSYEEEHHSHPELSGFQPIGRTEVAKTTMIIMIICFIINIIFLIIAILVIAILISGYKRVQQNQYDLISDNMITNMVFLLKKIFVSLTKKGLRAL